MHPVILMYHSITAARPTDTYAVSAESLDEHIRWLLSHGYAFVPLEELVDSKQRARAKVARPVALTFDDGYQDFAENALPVLMKYHLPATAFLVTDRIGKMSSWRGAARELPLMTRAQVRELKASGVNLGSHTLSHVDLTAVESPAELERQLVESRKALAEFEEEFPAFSYPWGRHTGREVQAVRAAGYECAVAIDEPAFFGADRCFRMSRIPMRKDTDALALGALVSGPSLRRRLGSQARHLLRALVN